MKALINILTYGFALISLISTIYLYFTMFDITIIFFGLFATAFFLIMNVVFKYFFKIWFISIKF